MEYPLNAIIQLNRGLILTNWAFAFFISDLDKYRTKESQDLIKWLHESLLLMHNIRRAMKNMLLSMLKGGILRCMSNKTTEDSKK